MARLHRFAKQCGQVERSESFQPGVRGIGVPAVVSNRLKQVLLRIPRETRYDYGGQPSLFASLRAKAGGRYRTRTCDIHGVNVAL